jgi:hypothetical protein
METTSKTTAEMYARRIMEDIGIWSEEEDLDEIAQMKKDLKKKRQKDKDKNYHTKFNPETVMNSLKRIDKE